MCIRDSSVTREADIVIVAAGRAGVVDESYVAPGQIVDVYKRQGEGIAADNDERMGYCTMLLERGLSLGLTEDDM